MINLRTSILLAAALTVATPAIAEFQISPEIVKALADAASEPEHSAVVPIDPPSGGGSGGGPVGLPKMTRNLPKGGGGGGGDSGGGGDDGFLTQKRGPGDLALLCEIEQDGDFVLLNGGSRVVPQGARIRWKAGDEKGFLSLNVDLEPGARAMAKDHSTASGAPCLATLL
jgi:hypothetical protein